MMRTSYTIAKIICPFLPPILSQRVRASLVRLSDGEKINSSFNKKSFTGSTFSGNTADFHAFKFSIHGYFDWRNIVIANTVMKFNPGNIIEVGANIGTETISFADIAAKHGKNVFAFEPLATNFDLLSENIASNGLNNTRLFKTLVSDVAGKSFFKIPSASDSGSGHITQIDDDGATEVETVTLDEVVTGRPVSLIAIDVEGYEFQVLKGAHEIISKDQPIIIAEVNGNYLMNRGGVTLEQFHDFVKKLNYNCFYINKFGLEEVDINAFKVKPNKNWVCIPSGRMQLALPIANAIRINALNPLFNFFYF